MLQLGLAPSPAGLVHRRSLCSGAQSITGRPSRSAAQPRIGRIQVSAIASPAIETTTTGGNGSGTAKVGAQIPAPVPPAPELAPPPAAYLKVVAAGAAKAALPANKVLLLGILAGVFIGFGAFLSISIGGACPGLASSNPGLQKMVAGAFGLPFGLLMVLVCGAELFTGNTALVTAAVYEGKATWGQLSRNWFFSYAGNLLGSLLLVGLVYATGLLATAPAPINAAVAKSSLPFLQAFSRGILCNWLVCSAVWQATAASSLPGKAVGVWFPISAFVALGLEHAVANMFAIPLGMALGAPVTLSQFVFGNIVPVTLGNVVGGVLCMATVYSLCYGTLGQKKDA